MTDASTAAKAIPAADRNGGLGPDQRLAEPHAPVVEAIVHALYGEGYEARCHCGWRGGFSEWPVHSRNSAWRHARESTNA